MNQYKFNVVEELRLKRKVCSKQIKKEMEKIDCFGYDFKSFEQAKFDLQSKGKLILSYEVPREFKIYSQDIETAQVQLLQKLNKEGFSNKFKILVRHLGIGSTIEQDYITNTFLTLVK